VKTVQIRKTKEDETSVEEFKHKEWKKFDKERGYQKKDKKYAFIAMKAKKIIGFIKFTITGGVGYLNQLIIGKDMRKKGIGRELIEKFEKICKEKKCHLLYLRTSEDHKDALNFYKKLGYRVSAILNNYEFNRKWYFLEKKLK